MTDQRHTSRDEADPTDFAAPAADQVELLFRSHGDVILRYCLFELGNLVDAEDAVSETFARLIRSPRRDNGAVEGDADRAWLFGIARNVIREQRRYRKRHPTHEIERLEDATDRTDLTPDDLVVQASESVAVREALQALKPDQREVLLLRFVAGLTSEEAGAALGKRAGAVRVQQMRAIEALRTQFLARGAER